MPKRIPRYIAEHSGSAYILLVCVAAASFAVLGILYHDQAVKTEQLAKESISLSLQIQQQRRITIYQGCREQNEKHRDLVNFIAEQGIMRNDGPQAEATYKFIDVLAPKRNCRKVVKAATTSD